MQWLLPFLQFTKLSALHTGRCDTLDELLLPDKEDDQNRDDRHDRTCHDHGVVRGVLRDEGLQTKLNGPQFRRTQVHQRTHEVVPCIGEGDDAQCRNRRTRQRQHDSQVNAEFGQTVEASCFRQLFRNRVVELLHHEHAESTEGLQ